MGLKIPKQFISLALALVMVISMVCSAFAAEGTGTDGSETVSEAAAEGTEDVDLESDLVYDLDGLLVTANGEEDMNSWRYQDGQPVETESGDAEDGITVISDDDADSGSDTDSDTDTESAGVAFGVDVSKYQGDIDWDTVRGSVSFVIIRCGYGSNLTDQDDAYFETNVEACERLGIPYGVYLYSYATTTTGAESEAQHVLRLLEGHTPSLPVYLDLEDSSITSACTEEEILANAEVFCTTIEDAGYEAGIYANQSWWVNYLTSDTYDQWDRWVAQWSTSCTYTGSYSYWQYSSAGSVSGISGNVDCDYAMGLPFSNSSTAEIANACLPSDDDVSSDPISGIISSSETITQVTASILTSDGAVVQTASAAPNGTSYELASLGFIPDTDLLTGGETYTCQVEATTDSGTVTVAESSFTFYILSASSSATLSAPALSCVEGTDCGVNLTWDAVEGATIYRVMRKVDGGSWETLTDTTSTSYTDTAAETGTTYVYSVCCVDEEGNLLSNFDSTGTTITYVDAPVLSGVQGTSSGVKVSWNAVDGAEQYQVYRETEGSAWEELGNTASTSFTDTTAEAGVTYTYTVRCVSADGTMFTGGYDTVGLTISYVATPVLSDLQGSSSGVRVSWEAVDGAERYWVYRKVDGGSWKRVRTTSSTACTDTTAETGVTYTYTVRCVSADGLMFVSGYDAAGLTITYVDAPTLSCVQGTASGVKVSWDAVDGAELYRVFRKAGGSSSWKTLGDTTSTSYTDTTAKAGVTYTYTVRCVTADAAAFTGGYDTAGLTIAYVDTPVLTGVSNTAKGVTVEWNAVDGAERYWVYRKVSGGSWKRVGITTTATSYTDTTAEAGVTYTYTVRCVNAGGTVFTSGYDAAGLSICAQ